MKLLSGPSLGFLIAISAPSKGYYLVQDDLRPIFGGFGRFFLLSYHFVFIFSNFLCIKFKNRKLFFAKTL